MHGHQQVMIKTEIGFAKGETRTPVFMINLTLPRDKEVQLNYGENYVLQSDMNAFIFYL